MAEIALIVMCAAICGLFYVNLKLHQRLKDRK